MKNEIKVLIIGANFINKGAEAMLLTVKQQLSLRFVSVKIYMICKYYEKNLAIDNGIEPIFINREVFIVRGFFLKVYKKVLNILGRKKLPYFETYPFNKIRSLEKNLDAIIDISGYAYGGDWGGIVIKKVLKLKSIFPGSKLIFLPQAWGPFHLQNHKNLMRKMLNASDKYYARDAYSQLELSKLLNVPLNSIARENDIVFSFDHQAEIRDHSSGFAKSENELLVGISPNMRIYEKSHTKEGGNGYITSLVSVARLLIKNHNAKIVLIPNEIKPIESGYADDRFLCRLLFASIERKGNCMLWDQYSGAAEIKDIISKLDILIGSRFHALIFAFSLHIPCVALSWSHKYRELFKIFGMENFVLEMEEMQEHEKLVELLNHIINNYSSVVEKIETKRMELNASINIMFDEVSKIVGV